MFATLVGNIDPVVVQEAFVTPEPVAMGVGILSVIVGLFLMVSFMILVVAAVVWVIMLICRRGSSDNELKQTIATQQTQIDTLTRELEEVKRKLEQ